MIKSDVWTTVGRSLGGTFFLRIAGQGATLLVTILLCRALGPDDFGRYSFLFGLFLILSLFNLGGLNDILSREMTTRPHLREKLYRNGLGLKFFSGLIALASAWILIIAFKITDLPLWAALAGSLTLWTSFSMTSVRTAWDAPYQVDIRMTSASLINFLSRLALALGLLIAIIIVFRGVPSLEELKPEVIKLSVSVVIALQIASEFLGCGAQMWMNRRFGYGFLPRWDPPTIRYLVREAAPMAVAGGLGIIYANISLLILKYYLNDEQVGLFALPLRLSDTLGIVPVVFAAAMFPVYAGVWRNNKADFEDLVALSFKIMTVLIAPVIVLCWQYNSLIIETLSGGAFHDSVRPLTLLVWTQLFWFGGLALNAAIIAMGLQRRLAAIYGLQALVSVGLNFVLIPYWGIIGSAWSAIAANASILLFALFFKDLRRLAGLWIARLPLPILGILAAKTLTRWFNFDFLPGLVFITLFLFGWVFILRYFTIDDVSRTVMLLRQRKKN